MFHFYASQADLDRFMAPPGQTPAMNQMVGASVVGLADPKVAELLPPQLTLTDPVHPLFYLYIAEIQKPTFSLPYREAGLGVFAKYGDAEGVYYFNLQLSGPGAEMATYIGRENAGIPKKLADAIGVEREGGTAHCYLERGGVRLCDLRLELGRYDLPLLHQPQEGCLPDKPIQVPGSSLYYKYELDGAFHDLRLIQYGGQLHYTGWEPAQAKITLQSSSADPWGEVPVLQPLMAGWMTCNSLFDRSKVLLEVPAEDADETMRHLLAGRFDPA